MKAKEIIPLIADHAGLSLEGRGKNAVACGALLGFPVRVAAVDVLFLGSSFGVNFETRNPVDVDALNAKVNAHRDTILFPEEHDLLVIEIPVESASDGVAGVGGAVGVVLQVAAAVVDAVDARTHSEPGGAFSLSVNNIGKKDAADTIELKFDKALAALEQAIQALGIQ